MDFDQKAYDLFASLGLDRSGNVAAKAAGGSIYRPLDAVFKDRKTGGTIFVGNQMAAQNAMLLKQNNITHIVNCTDNMPLYHQKEFTYYRFNVTFWAQRGEDHKTVEAFLAPMFDFVESAVASGGSVLVHCLAGAHRAGTTGCLLLMREAGLSSMEAVATAKKLRPVIDPIGRFPELLRIFDVLNESRRKELRAKAAAGGAGASEEAAR
jgi:predicted protein tyrosine phosphatase